MERVHATPDDDPFNKEIMIEHYGRHDKSVLDHFKDRTCDLLVIYLAEKSAYKRFGHFMGMQIPITDFPWENRARRIEPTALALSGLSPGPQCGTHLNAEK